MPEQEQETEKKKTSIVKRVLKWIGLGLLALQLIAFIIFQAPWKFITLLVIILLACTILPKTLRKWFWLSVGVVIIALIIWVFLPADNEGWRPYTFDEELAALEAARSIPDSENAAIIYNQLLDNYDANTFEPNFMDDDLDDLTRREPWLSKDHPEVAQWLQQHNGTISKLLQASKIEKCRFPIVADTVSFGQHIKRFAPIRRWARLLIRAGNNDIADGRTNQAIEKYIAVLQMARHQCQQPTIIDVLVGIAIEAIATSQFKTFIVTGDVTEERLNVIEQALSDIKHDWSSDFPRILEGEKLMAKNMLCGILYEVNPQGKTRFSRDPRAAITSQFAKDMSPTTYWQKKLTKVGIILGWFIMPSTPQKLSKIIDAAYEKYYAMTEPGFDWKKEPREFSITSIRLNYRRMMEMAYHTAEPVYRSIHDSYLRHTTNQTGVRLIITLRRYKNKNGIWPQSLDDVKDITAPETLIDPVNNSSFVYKPTDDDFTLYSKGKNNIDEGGKRDKWNEEKTGADDWLIWPQKTRKTQKKKANAEQQ